MYWKESHAQRKLGDGVSRASVSSIINLGLFDKGRLCVALAGSINQERSPFELWCRRDERSFFSFSNTVGGNHTYKTQRERRKIRY